MRYSNVGIILLGAWAFACAGCAGGTTLQVTGCPNPVLLGPVDRIGGHRATPATSLHRVRAEAHDWVSASAETKGGVTTTTTRGGSVGSERIGFELLEKTEGRIERDVRVRKLPIGAWAWITSVGGGSNAWAGLDVDVVEVPRGR